MRLPLLILLLGATILPANAEPGPASDYVQQQSEKYRTHPSAMWFGPDERHAKASDLNNAGLQSLELELNRATLQHDAEGITTGLRLLEQFWTQAVSLHNTDAIAHVEADEFICTDPSGAVTGKEDDLEVAKSAALQLTSYKLEDVRTILHGDTAILTGKTTFTGHTTLDLAISGSYRWTDVFIFRDGRWQVTASQATNILPPAFGERAAN